jgi:hypothetical protein
MSGAEVLGITASIIGMVPILQQMGKALRQRDWDSAPLKLKERLLKLETHILRVTVIQESINYRNLDLSSSSNQETLRLFESVVRQSIKLAEDIPNQLRNLHTAGKGIRRVLKMGQLESNLAKQDKELAEVGERLSLVEFRLTSSLLGASLRLEQPPGRDLTASSISKSRSVFIIDENRPRVWKAMTTC